MKRAMMSAPPPVPAGTLNSTGLVGCQAAALVPLHAPTSATARTVTTNGVQNFLMIPSAPDIDGSSVLIDARSEGTGISTGAPDAIGLLPQTPSTFNSPRHFLYLDVRSRRFRHAESRRPARRDEHPLPLASSRIRPQTDGHAPPKKKGEGVRPRPSVSQTAGTPLRPIYGTVSGTPRLPARKPTCASGLTKNRSYCAGNPVPSPTSIAS